MSILEGAMSITISTRAGRQSLLALSLAILSISLSPCALAQGTATDTAGADSDKLGEIVVRGVRQSVESAQAVKQNAIQITDSVVAEDIGKLPDNSVAEALQRVTGVQINRGRGDASLTLVRGLPNVVTTLNGRQVFTTTGRGIALADIPADLLERVEVYKSQSADQFSGGIAGAINVELRRPFDFDGFEVAGSLRGVYTDQAEETDPIASALISNRWNTDAGDFGVLLGGSYQKVNFLESNTFDGTYDLVPNPSNPAQQIFRPFVIGSIYTLGDRERDSANLSMQWSPSDGSEYYFEAFYVKYQEDFELNFWIPLPGITADSATLRPNSNVAETWISTNIFTLTSNQAFERESETYQFAVGGKWDLNDALSMHSDLSYTQSDALNRGVILDTGFIAPMMEVDFSDRGASNARIFEADGVTPVDVTDSSLYWMEQLFDQREAQDGDDVNFTVDLSYELGGVLTAFDGGLQLGSRSAENREANGGGVNRNANAPPGVDNLVFVDDVEALTGLPGIQDVSASGLLDGERDVWTDQWFVANREYLLNNTPAIRELFFLPPGDPPDDPANFFSDDEDTYAAYVQARFGWDWGSVPVDGALGVRYVKVDSSLRGTQRVTDTSTGNTIDTPVEIDKSDEEFLPSLNVRFKLQDDLHLRLALFRTVTRPNFEDLNPQTVLTQPGPTLPGQGFGGNPNLDNVEAKSADLSFEWYFGQGGLVSTALFYRDITGYIQRFSTEEVFNGETFDVTRPQSSGDGEMKGLELAYTQFFDRLPGFLSGFGLQLNYTKIDAFAVVQDSRTLEFVEKDLTNVSDDSYNAILMYEKYNLSARLAYNWRSDYVESYNQGGAQPEAVRVKDVDQMDFSLGYHVNDSLTITFDATNLLDKPVYNYFGGGSASAENFYLFPRDVRSNDTTYSLGVRMRM
jgi:TonB-dependent receptor